MVGGHVNALIIFLLGFFHYAMVLLSNVDLRRVRL